MSWRERLEELCRLYYDEEREVRPPAVSSATMLDAMAAEIEAAERVAEAALTVGNPCRTDAEVALAEAIITYRALRGKAG